VLVKDHEAHAQARHHRHYSAARWLPLPVVLGYKGHSLVFETGGSVPVSV